MSEKILFQFLLAICCDVLCTSSAFSQCTIAIPSDAHVFDTSKTVSSSGADIIGSNWICAGDTLVITSGFGSQTFFLEEGAVLYGGGGGSRTVYLKPGAFFDCGGGGGQLITYDSTSSYGNCGSVYPTYCHPLVFDYTNAPLNGCNIATSIPEFFSKYEMKIYPDPADDHVQIDMSDKQDHDYVLKVFNSTGKEILDERIKQFPHDLKTSALTEGIYLLILLRDGGMLSECKLLIAR